MTSDAGEQTSFNTTIPLIDHTTKELPVSPSAPLFIVGQNGVGKSGLMLTLYRQNVARSVRISAQRQTWMESNYVPFTPQDKTNTEINTKSQDSTAAARYKEWNAQQRAGLVIANLINAENDISRISRLLLIEGNIEAARNSALSPTPLEIISEIFQNSGISMSFSIVENSAIFASKNGCAPYSIAALSDGERAALLIAGSVLTASEDSLIIIDEPERHLHSSIVTPLLSQLFSKRPDCTFVISTHELSLPLANPRAKVVIVRSSIVEGDQVNRWDIDILDDPASIDDNTKNAIIGSRRNILFVEGTSDSLDQPIYEILFPGASLVAKESCGAVERSVRSIRESSHLHWIQAFGIVDLDQINDEKKALLESDGVFCLSAYSVESLYYCVPMIEALAERQSAVLGGNPKDLVTTAKAALLAEVSRHVDRLSARMTEQVVKDKISLQMPDWKFIKSETSVNITIDSQSLYLAEKSRMQYMIDNSDVDGIIKRYPVRQTPALDAISSALQFKNRAGYESAVRNLLRESAELRTLLLSQFGELPSKLS